LKQRTEANSEKHKKDLLMRNCLRQAEMGVGDCAGLRLIPGASFARFVGRSFETFLRDGILRTDASCTPVHAGATKSGIQKKPEWMLKLLGQTEEGK
jgi:hypothetical protein